MLRARPFFRFESTESKETKGVPEESDSFQAHWVIDGVALEAADSCQDDLLMPNPEAWR